MRRACFTITLLALAVAACGDSESPGELALAALPPVLNTVSAATPFAANCDDAVPGGGTVYPNAEVEPFIAINPLNPSNLIGVWQQDRWSTGGAHGLLAAASFDGGQSWAIRQAAFSRCSGGTPANGGDYARASDPWVSIGPDGTAYWMALTIFVPQLPNGMLVARSIDGGLSWDDPVTLIRDTTGEFNDKGALTADPFTPGFAYAVWDRLDNNGFGPTWFSRTIDGGVSWEAAKIIYDPGEGAQTLGNQIVVLPDGTLVNLLTEIHPSSGIALLKVIRSTDQGVNWSVPVQVAEALVLGTRDPHTGTPVRDGGLLAAIAVGPTGVIYVAWQDSRFANGARDGIVLAMSVDGGLTWGAPVQVNSVPSAPAFTPSVAVAPDGTLGVSYFDLRDDIGGSLPTGYWLTTSTDSVNWSERRIALPFDITRAPMAGGWFVGDYQGLTAAGSGFSLLFVTANDSTANRTDVRFVTRPTVAPAKQLALHRAPEAPVVRVTPEWRARIADKIERERHDFPDRIPQYLRRAS